MAQIRENRHPLKFCLPVFDLQSRFVEGDVQRHRRAISPFQQGVVLHQRVGQHGYLVAGHVHGGEAAAAEFVDGVARLHGQGGRRDVDADCDFARAQAAHTQRVVNFRGGRVVD